MRWKEEKEQGTQKGVGRQARRSKGMQIKEQRHLDDGFEGRNTN